MPELDAPALAAARLACALAGLAMAIGWERTRPYQRVPRRRARARANLGLWGLGAGLVPLLPGVAGVAAATLADSSGIGLLHWVGAPGLVGFLVTVLLLDATSCQLHRLYHALPLLWRLHRVHHSDVYLTVTSGVRFHPLEVVLSACVRAAVIVALGADVVGVAVFEALLLLLSQLQHADARLPAWIEPRLSRVLFTPDLHRIHHSRRRDEADSNYGSILTLWDRLGRTLRTGPRPGAIVVGPPDGALGDPDSFSHLLALPFQRARSASSQQPAHCSGAAARCSDSPSSGALRIERPEQPGIELASSPRMNRRRMDTRPSSTHGRNAG